MAGPSPRFHVHFTPTGSSWINQVERWFGLLTDKLIRRGVHTSVAALEKDIQAWIDTWNENPRPITWIKTADEILESLADYLAKIRPGHVINRGRGGVPRVTAAPGSRTPDPPKPRRRRTEHKLWCAI